MKYNLDEMSTSALTDLMVQIEDELISRHPSEAEELMSRHWSNFKGALRKISTDYQVDCLKNWSQLTQVKKDKFTKMWKHAVRKLTELGLVPSTSLDRLIISLVIRSSYIDKFHLSFDSICEGLLEIVNCFEHSFPGYLDNPESLCALRKTFNV